MGWPGPSLAASGGASSGARCADSTLTFDWWWIVGGKAGDDARLLISEEDRARCQRARGHAQHAQPAATTRPRRRVCQPQSGIARTPRAEHARSCSRAAWRPSDTPRGTHRLTLGRHARIPLDAPRGSRADPIGRPARTPSTRFMYSHTRGTAVITAQSPASRQQARSKHSRSARGDRTATVSSRKHLWGPTRGGLRILFRLGCSYLFTASQRCTQSMKPLGQSA